MACEIKRRDCFAWLWFGLNFYSNFWQVVSNAQLCSHIAWIWIFLLCLLYNNSFLTAFAFGLFFFFFSFSFEEKPWLLFQLAKEHFRREETVTSLAFLWSRSLFFPPLLYCSCWFFFLVSDLFFFSSASGSAIPFSSSWHLPTLGPVISFGSEVFSLCSWEEKLV